MSKVCTGIMLLCLFAACAPKVRTRITQKYPPLAYNESIVVIGLRQATPPGELLGTVKIGDSGMTVNCDFATAIEKAKEEARKAGGNVVKIIEHKTPDFGSTCHRITVEVLRVEKSVSHNQAHPQRYLTSMPTPSMPHFLYIVSEEQGRWLATTCILATR